MSMNIYEIEERGILQCQDVDMVVRNVYGCDDMPMRGGLGDNM